jgi:hypothetical protein
MIRGLVPLISYIGKYGMTSNWALPTLITQYAEPSAENHHVSWLEVDGFSGLKNKDGRSIKTSRDLVHIAKEPRHDLTEKTYFLKITGFTFTSLPETLLGIEVRLTMQRYGRISDETIQLCLNDTLVGDNQTTFNLDPIKLYGNETSIWNTQLTIANIQDPSFGVILRFRSHPSWPHKNGALIDAVEIRVH